jgi:hypothetical protein
VVIQAGIREDKAEYLDLLTEEEYLDILEHFRKTTSMLDDMDPKKFIAKMGAEAVHDACTHRPQSVSFQPYAMLLPTKHRSNVKQML